MYTDNTLRVIQDNQAFTHIDTGVKYPRNYPKDEIIGLFPVTLIDRPIDDATYITTDFVIQDIIGIHTQVWDTRLKTAEELQADADAIAALIPTWDDVDSLQNELLSVNSSVMKRIVRYETQLALTGKTPKENATKYQELLQYADDVRDNDATTHATPQLALDALNALPEPI